MLSLPVVGGFLCDVYGYGLLAVSVEDKKNDGLQRYTQKGFDEVTKLSQTS